MKERRRIKIEFDLIGNEAQRAIFLSELHCQLEQPGDWAQVENVTVTSCGVDISSNYRNPEGLDKKCLDVR